MTKPSPAVTISPAVRALVTGLVDYAGLFPPAQLGMAEAMRNYAEYLAGPHAWILGRFVVPVARLPEFDAVSGELLPKGEGSEPWKISALAGDDLAADAQLALKFNCRHWEGSEIGHAVIDTIEVRASAPLDPGAIRAAVPDFFTLYFEIPVDTHPGAMLDSVHLAGARAKIRLGGVTPEAFPSPDDVVAFMNSCRERAIAFKATAGLHHLIRSDYPLTYERGGPRSTMYGFLNVFLAAVAMFSGGNSHEALAILLEDDLSAFQFDGTGISWGGRRLASADIAHAREFATSFGSCSFREPADELRSAGLI